MGIRYRPCGVRYGEEGAVLMAHPNPVPMQFPPQWPYMNISGQFGSSRYMPKFKVHNWPPPSSMVGPFLGWSEDYKPHVVYKHSDGSSSKGWSWHALGLENYHEGYRPVIRRLAEGSDQEKFIKYWAHSPMGDDPNSFDREMETKDEAPGASPLAHPMPKTNNYLLRRMYNAIKHPLGKK